MGDWTDPLRCHDYATDGSRRHCLPGAARVALRTARDGGPSTDVSAASRRRRRCAMIDLPA